MILRHGPGVRRHAMLAAEFGASWEDIVGTLVLTQPGFGFIPAMEALPMPARASRRAWRRGWPTCRRSTTTTSRTSPAPGRRRPSTLDDEVGQLVEMVA